MSVQLVRRPGAAWWRLVCAGIALGVFVIGRPLGTAAQDATPAASPGTGGSPDTLVEAMIPAASIPNDDKWMAQASGYGRVVKEWLRVKDGALRGFE